MATLLILGGTAFQIPAITHALKLGHRVITCDFTPENPGHRYAHEYYNISTIDKQSVLEIARTCSIDGILASASDPAASTASYVASNLALPGERPEAIEMLRNKHLFREFLSVHGFKIPRFAAPLNEADAFEMAKSIGYPMMIKPSDSSGSKGISRVVKPEELSAAYQLALKHSLTYQVVIEQWIERKGCQIAGDGVVVDGAVVFGCFGDEHFDTECAMYAPVGESFPGQITNEQHKELMAQLNRLFSLLGVRHLVFNLDAMIDCHGEIILIEIGPRSGGNFIPQIIRHHTGVDLVDIAIRQALGEPIPPSTYQSKSTGFFASWMIHARTNGRLAGFEASPDLGEFIIDIGLLARPGSLVQNFQSSRDTLGYAIFSFPSATLMRDNLACMGSLLAPLVISNNRS